MQGVGIIVLFYILLIVCFVMGFLNVLSFLDTFSMH